MQEAIKYYKCKKGETQYDDLMNEKIVPARYIRAMEPMDDGNRFIEALPPPRKEEEIQIAYERPLLSYDFDNVKDLSHLEKMLQIGTLRKLRFPLPFHQDLEFNVYNALVTSYRDRETITSDNSITYVSDNTLQKSNSKLVGDSKKATNAGFALIGKSGCGKSSAIDIALSRYPQVIMHRDGMRRYPQIVYLVVNCIANSNFSALYQAIGAEIDTALGNLEPIYELEVLKQRGLGEKAAKIKEYIEKFGIGMIVLDEIQLIDFSHTRENTFEALLTLANRTKVAIAVVGTEDARAKMFRELRTTRRIGMIVNGDLYCDKKKFFAYLVAKLFEYQWFDKPVKPTNDIIDALYDMSKGIVDQLVGIYSCMNYEYINRNKKPEINGDFVRRVAEKYYPGMQKVLKDMDMEDADEMIAKIKKDNMLKVNAIIEQAKQDEQAELVISNSETFSERKIILKDVADIIRQIYPDYTDAVITDAFNKVMNTKTAKGKTSPEIAGLVIDRLKASARKKKSNSKKPTNSQMLNYLDMEEQKNATDTKCS